MTDDADERIRGTAPVPGPREALQGLMDCIKKGQLVRDTSHDHEHDWAMKQIPLVRALADAHEALRRAAVEHCLYEEHRYLTPMAYAPAGKDAPREPFSVKDAMAEDRAKWKLVRTGEDATPRTPTDDIRGFARSCLYGVMGYLGVKEMDDRAVESVASRLADEFARRSAMPRTPLRNAAQAVWDLIEQGKLVRDISGDGASDWAIKQIPVVKALADLQKALAPIEGEANAPR